MISSSPGSTLKHGSVLELTGETLSLADLVRVARDPRISVGVAPTAWARVIAARERLERAIARYERAHDSGDAACITCAHVYGVTTGFGAFKYAAVSPSDLLQLQSNLVRSHAVGVGRTFEVDEPGNYLPAEVVRAALLLRLNSFLKGFSGVRPQLVRALQGIINAGVIPLAPTKGSLGASGDLCPLAHIALVLLGEGRFYVVRSPDDVQRSWRGCMACDALSLPSVSPALAADLAVLESAHAVPWPTRPLSYKEGLALINGSSVSAGMLALAAHDATVLLDTADVAAALTLEALCGQSAAFDPRVHAARGQPGQQTVATRVRALVAGSEFVDSAPEHVQDAYSLRCVPQVHGASRDAVGFVLGAVGRELNAATDNPLLFSRNGSSDELAPSDEEIELDVVSGGNFHGQPIGLAADFAAIAVAELGSIAERRVQMLLDAHHNRGLPANLTRAPGLNSGLMIAQYTAASIVSENKGRCHPACVDSIPTSANSEDHNSMAMTAARKLRSVVSNVEAVLAIELLTASQAVDLRFGLMADPQRGAFAECASDSTVPPDILSGHLGAGTGAAYHALRNVSPCVAADRSLEPDIRAVRRQVWTGDIAAQAACAVEGGASEARLPCDHHFDPACGTVATGKSHSDTPLWHTVTHTELPNF